jgi:iron only hydrogenase large subunit-like protein
MKRIKALYEIDNKMKTRKSHENEAVKAIYKEFLVSPNSHKAHEVLHTEYINRKKLK